MRMDFAVSAMEMESASARGFRTEAWETAYASWEAQGGAREEIWWETSSSCGSSAGRTLAARVAAGAGKFAPCDQFSVGAWATWHSRHCWSSCRPLCQWATARKENDKTVSATNMASQRRLVLPDITKQ
jgi:hypothetical protein